MLYCGAQLSTSRTENIQEVRYTVATHFLGSNEVTSIRMQHLCMYHMFCDIVEMLA